jgi:ankyrin repeat protein
MKAQLSWETNIHAVGRRQYDDDDTITLGDKQLYDIYMDETTPILSSNTSTPQDTPPPPSNENEHRELFDLMANKKWSEATILVENKDNQRTQQEIKKLLFYQDEEGRTALNSNVFKAPKGAPHNMPPDNLILKMMDIGNMKLVRIAQKNGWTILHDVCRWSASPRVILKAIEIGKKEIVTKTIKNGNTSLHWLLLKYKDETYMEVFHKLVEVGGAEMLKLKNSSGKTPLHMHLTLEKPSLEILKKVIKFGGAEMLKLKDNNGNTPVHVHLNRKNSSLEIVKEVIKVGGVDILKLKNNTGNTPLHLHFRTKKPSLEIWRLIVKESGEDGVLLVTLLSNKNKDNWTPLHDLCYFSKDEEAFKGIMPTVGDAFTDTALITLKDNNNWSLLDAACQRSDPQPHIIKYLIDKGYNAFKIMLEKTKPKENKKDDNTVAKKAEEDLLKFQTLWNLSDDYAARYAANIISKDKIKDTQDTIETGHLSSSKSASIVRNRVRDALTKISFL